MLPEPWVIVFFVDQKYFLIQTQPSIRWCIDTQLTS